MAARKAHNLEVVGSNPTPATIFIYNCWQGSSVVEQWTHKPPVAGSIPAPAIFFYKKLVFKN